MDQGGTGQGTGNAPPPLARRPPAPSPSSTATARGGIITLVRDDIPYSVNESPYRPLQPDSNTQCSSTTIHATKAFNLTVINIYVPPARWAPGQGTQEQIFQPDGIRTIGDTVVGGDFNAHSLSWDPFQPESAIGEAIEEWARDSNLLILNDGSPTRHNPSTTQSATTEGRSAPDVTMLSQSLARSREVKWATQRGIGSDHLPILTTISASCTRIRGRRGGRGRFCHRRADWTNFRLRCDQLISDWSDQPISLSAACRRLTDTILQAARSSVPFGSGSGRRPPFWNAECQAAVDARERALAAATRSGHSSEDVRRYQAARAAADHAVAQQKTEFFNKKLAEMGPDKDMWSLIKTMDGRIPPARPAVSISRPGVEGQPSQPTRPAITDREKAELFCQSYARVSRLLKTKITDHPIKVEARGAAASTACCSGQRTAFCSPFSLQELRQAVAKLKPGRSPGTDSITNDMIHQLSPRAESEMLALINRSWSEGAVPSPWRIAEIVAIPKKGKPLTEPSSYRPISLLSCVGKLAERLVQQRLQHWLEAAGKINPNQAGFRRGHSTLDQLARVTQSIFDALEVPRTKHTRPQRAVLALLDFTAAYDRVWRDALWAKMGRLGVPGCAIRWIRALLSDRRARVRWGGATSKWRVFQEGLPQGSVLAPLLWLIYINDLTVAADDSTTASLFADDVAVLATADSLEKCAEKLQPVLDGIERWASTSVTRAS